MSEFTPVSSNSHLLKELSSKLTLFFLPGFLEYERIGLQAEVSSFILEDNKNYLVSPVLIHDEISIGTPSFLPVPFFIGQSHKILKRFLLEYLETLKKVDKPVSLRVDPCLSYADETLYFFLDRGFKPKTHFTTLFDLKQSEDALWQQISSGYRNCIRKTEREVEIKTITNEDKFFSEWKHLYSIVTQRANATPSELTFEKLGNLYTDENLFYVGAFENSKLVSAVEIGITNHSAYYLHSATHPEFEGKSNYTHALLWRALLEAKKQGAIKFEIGPLHFDQHDEQSRKLRNISFFKRQMGGTLTAFLNLTASPQDIILT